ncbi:MAG: tetratricopeptide repeat protein [Candidatus Omnitrophica bacterium]|nr:tetratricopeptide repeat protein [Candidatus Omnitrophota bacterium]
MSDAKHLYDEALALFRSGNLTQAISQLEEVVRKDPELEDVLETLGVLYAKADRLDEAIETMKHLLRFSPNHIMAHTNLSRFYVQKGMILEAEKEQAEARRLSWKAELKAQKTLSGQEQSSEDETGKGDKDVQARITRYQRVIELDPEDVLGYFSLGTAYLDGRRSEEARKAFEQAIQVDPNHSPSYFSLGVALEALERTKEAVHVYEQGLKVADRRGDMIPLKKMEMRLKALKGNLSLGP